MRYPRARHHRRIIVALPIVLAFAATGAVAQTLHSEDAVGTLRTYVGLATDESGLIKLFSSNGQATVELFADDDGGAVKARMFPVSAYGTN